MLYGEEIRLNKKYDYVVVGSGLFGSVFANLATEDGNSCLVIDKRTHIGGNCYTKRVEDIDVHVYGPHIFHTNSQKIWDYINKFCTMNAFQTKVKVYNEKFYSFPINLMTLNQLWGVKTPEEAKSILNSKTVKVENPRNLEEWCLSMVGEEIYIKFIKGYTKKQWGTDPKKLPCSIIKRIPIRTTFDDNYFNDKFQGIPDEGYENIFKKMLEKCDVELNVDYFKNRDFYDSIAKKKVIYTGPIDEFYDYSEGELEWRSLRFESEYIENHTFQGNCVVNYTSERIPYTRIVEHKFFNFKNQKNTIITKEYPEKWSNGKEKFYPINDRKNNSLYLKYKSKINKDKYIFGGRLAEYKYYDMHQVIGAAMKRYGDEL